MDGVAESANVREQNGPPVIAREPSSFLFFFFFFPTASESRLSESNDNFERFGLLGGAGKKEKSDTRARGGEGAR